jgi:hypothetical protein
MTERNPSPNLGLEPSTKRSLINFLQHERKDSVRFLAVRDWVAIQLAQAEENRALFLADAQGAARARERITEIDARMSQMEQDPAYGLSYFSGYRGFEQTIFINFLRDSQRAVRPTGSAVLTVVEQRIWAAQKVFEAYPRLRQART